MGVASVYHQYSLTSSPWLPSGPARPNMRSLTMGSTPFHSASERHQFWSRSLKPAMPSSFQRYTRERAWSCGNQSQASPSGL